MITKIILFAVIAACGVQSNSAACPDERLGGDSYWDGEAQAAADAVARDWLDRRMKAEVPPTEHPDGPPPRDDGHYFCCLEVDAKTKTGEGCITISYLQVDTCSTVLYCQEFVKKDNKVTCL